MMKTLSCIAGLACVAGSTAAVAGEVSIKYDEQQNLVASISIGDRYDVDAPSPYGYVDSAFIMYNEGWAEDGYLSPFDDSFMIGAYESADPEATITDSPGYFHCMIPRKSKLFNKVRTFLMHGNGASTILVTAPDPMNVIDGFPECLTFNPGGTSTRVAEINLAWAPFWLYNMQDPTGAPFSSFYGSFVPFPLSNGQLIRSVEIAEVSKSTDPATSGSAVQIMARDDSLVGDGPVFGPNFYCAKPVDSSNSDIYLELSNSPSRHITFGVENDPFTDRCKHLYVEMSTWLFQM